MRQFIALLVLVLTALAPDAVRAHAALVRADPADGQVLTSAPSMVHLRFNEPVQPLVMRLFDAAGRTYPDLAVERHGEMVMVIMPPGLGRGSHVLSYRVISIDGHPVAGSLTFSIGQAGLGPVGAADSNAGVRALLWLSRVVLYAGLFVGVGGAFFRAWLTPELRDQTTAGLLISALGTGAIAALLALGLQGLDALGEPLPVLASGPIWQAGLGTTYGRTVIVALLALASAGGSLVVASLRMRRCLAFVALLGVGLGLAASGHASSASPQWLTRPAVLAHGIAVAYWIGALAPLALLLRRGEPELPRIVRRFSNGAVLAVAALVLTGTALSWIQVRHPAALLATAYGQILSIKLVLVAVLFVLAGINRSRLTPALGRAGMAERRLSISAFAELVLAAAIFGLVGLWRFTPPPRAIQIEMPADQPAVVHIHTPQVIAEVTLVPGRAGPTRVRIVLSGASGPLDPKEMTIRLANKGAGVETIERRAVRSNGRTWSVEGLALPVAGRWELEVEALISDFEKATLVGEIEIRP